jgi:hypothetical protein
MKAVLAGLSGQKKLYYILDANSRENDGAVVTPDGKVVVVSFFGFATSARKLKRLQKTPFHKFLWTEPDGEIKKIWIDTFIMKSRPISKRFMDGLVIHSSLGSQAKKQKNIETRVKSFLNESNERLEKLISFSTLNDKTIDNGESNGN